MTPLGSIAPRTNASNRLCGSSRINSAAAPQCLISLNCLETTTMMSSPEAHTSTTPNLGIASVTGVTGSAATINPPSSASASGSASQTQTSERRCENPDCNVNKLISMVPKRKTTQFISEPKVMEKPMLVNGFTAVFQVEGQSAKLMDIKNPNGDPNVKSIYRVVPNSHVHVVNYVVVDTDEAYLKKITNNDPATMQKLLTTQKDSADQMLRKIMNGQGTTATAASTTVVSTINPPQNRSMVDNNPNSFSPIVKPPSSLSISMATAAATPASTTVPNQAGKMLPNASINLPVRMHPNLKITAVASADSVGSTNTIAAHPSPPFIQPVPLANLQTPSAVAAATSVATGAVPQQLTKPPPATLKLQAKTVPSPAMNVPDKPTYDKMQEEINDLRRTVAMLAEAQAKNLNQQPGVTPVAAKRPRLQVPQ
ncbi:uncharacterized protein LOC133329590 [Musca vetustissima]|uniref:uncharacterized protein LOC133329590 n=1 Tax=Musca vetustissima TaxID=27455 RepID=UPI002AB60ABC|nr:uncharacterized protein LOC133329590 [Musca vetustissima]